MAGTPPHVVANVASWERRHPDQLDVAARQWVAPEPTWGVFGISEGVARILPERVDDLDVVELGCGTGYVSAWLAQRGARPIGVDPTPGQLAIARQCQEQIGPSFSLVRAAGEQVPLRSASFDLVISEYGAAIWADPEAWIPEAARLLRPGGELIFLGTSTLLVLCVPDDDGVATDRLLREQFGMGRFVWPDDEEVEFHLSHGHWIRLLRVNGFHIEDLLELRPEEGATTPYPFVTPEWARRWPAEEVWRARKLGG